MRIEDDLLYFKRVVHNSILMSYTTSFQHNLPNYWDFTLFLSIIEIFLYFRLYYKVWNKMRERMFASFIFLYWCQILLLPSNEWRMSKKMFLQNHSLYLNIILEEKGKNRINYFIYFCSITNYEFIEKFIWKMILSTSIWKFIYTISGNDISGHAQCWKGWIPAQLALGSCRSCHSLNSNCNSSFLLWRIRYDVDQYFYRLNRLNCLSTCIIQLGLIWDYSYL